MKRFIFPILTIFSVTFLSAQEVKKEYYDEEEKQIKAEYTLVNGKKNGVEKGYFENGVLAAEKLYKDGRLDGLCKYNYDSGNPRYEKIYKGGLQNGIMKEFYFNGTLMMEKMYKGGSPNGVCKYYSEDGKLRTQENFVRGSRDGVSKMFFPDGTVVSETPYVKGDKHGVVKDFDEEGGLLIEANYAKNRHDGLTRTFYSKDKPAAEFSYNKGTLTLVKRYDVDGALWMEKEVKSKEKKKVFIELDEKEAGKLDVDGKKIYETKKALDEVRKFMPGAFSRLKSVRFKGIKKVIRETFKLGVPFESIMDSNDVKLKFDGAGGFYLDSYSGEVYLNIKGKDVKGVPYYEY